MRRVLHRTLKRAGQLVGLDVRWHVRRPEHALSTLLELYAVDIVLDVGANIGNSGDYLRNIGFCGRIVSFEPVAELYSQLERKAARDRRWHCERLALGDVRAEMNINVSGGDGSASSFLEMTDTIPENAPELKHSSSETVIVDTIDSVVGRYCGERDRIFLKLDAQGYEKRILHGAKDSLHRVVGMKIELSIVQSYEGEPLICEMLPYLYDLGFRLHGIEAAWSNRVTQEVFQVDGFLFRPDR